MRRASTVVVMLWVSTASAGEPVRYAIAPPVLYGEVPAEWHALRASIAEVFTKHTKLAAASAATRPELLIRPMIACGRTECSAQFTVSLGELRTSLELSEVVGAPKDFDSVVATAARRAAENLALGHQGLGPEAPSVVFAAPAWQGEQSSYFCAVARTTFDAQMEESRLWRRATGAEKPEVTLEGECAFDEAAGAAITLRAKRATGGVVQEWLRKTSPQGAGIAMFDDGLSRRVIASYPQVRGALTQAR